MFEPSRTHELVELAAIVRAHGLQGELLLKLFNPESELVEQLSEVVLRSPDGSTRPYRVLGVRGGSDATLLTLEGIRDRGAAELMRGSVVCVLRSSLPPLEEGEYYLVDLVGLAVRNEGGETIGRVESVIEYPSVSCLVIETDGEWREVPDLPRYVLEVAVRGGYVVVDHLDEIDTVAPPSQTRR